LWLFLNVLQRGNIVIKIKSAQKSAFNKVSFCKCFWF
jgi:hypothetical protein